MNEVCNSELKGLKSKDIKVAICQPNYLPWMGYFEMIDWVDTFVFLDDVQYSKHNWINRNKIRKNLKGMETLWLSVPVQQTKLKTTLIQNTLIDNSQKWAERHLKCLTQNYSTSRFFGLYFPLVQEGLSKKWHCLADLNVSLIQVLSKVLGINTNFVRSSELKVPGTKTNKLIGICKKLGATYYLVNNGSSPYIDMEGIRNAGIGCDFQDFRHPLYRQLHKDRELEFISHLSVLDLLFHIGPESLELIQKGTAKERKMFIKANNDRV